MEPPKKKHKKESKDYDLNTLEDIQDYQNKLDNLNSEMNNEIVKIEQKFRQLREEYLKKRSEKITTIPNFWKTAIRNHPDLHLFLENTDEQDYLNYLTKLTVEDTTNGYRINFYFKENPFFENQTLTKEYQWGFPNDSSKCIPIQWKSAQYSASNKISNDHKKIGGKRNLEKYSFLMWYKNNNHICNIIGETIRNELWFHPLQYFRNEINDATIPIGNKE